MNKIELLPKDIYFDNTLYQIAMWVTAFGRLCIGYRKSLDSNHESLFSVCVEPENPSHSITERDSGWLNAGIGNAVSVDDACEELLDYIEKHKEEFSCHYLD